LQSVDRLALVLVALGYIPNQQTCCHSIFRLSFSLHCMSHATTRLPCQMTYRKRQLWHAKEYSQFHHDKPMLQISLGYCLVSGLVLPE